MNVLPKMIMPGDKRPGIWRNGICQVMLTRACDLSCHSCTAGSNLGGKPMMITVEQFEAAVISLQDYFGVVGIFGGNPAKHPKFDVICQVLRKHIPFERRGLWCNNLLGKGAHARVTFNPRHSNLNVHMSSEAHAEFLRDWPESAPYLKGLDQDSVHSSPWVAMKDVEPDEAKRWKMIGDCDINKHWSSLIGVFRGELRGWFCEIAAHQAMLHQDNPDWDGTGRPLEDTGVAIEAGWWKRPMADFESQVRLHCHACGIPLRRPGQLAIGGEKEEFSKTHEFIAQPKTKGRVVELVQLGGLASRPERPATQYLPGVTPGYQGK